MIGGMVCAGGAMAAHPLQTEDTGTQGAGNVELENGLSWTRSDGAKVFVYQPQISYGVTPSFDLIVQPSWLRTRAAGGDTASGWGDTNLDGKWRFYGEAPLSLGIRAGATLATSENGLGNPHGKTTAHAVLVATVDAAPFTIHANVGVAQNPSGTGLRSHTYLISSALMWQVTEQWILTADAGVTSSSDPASRSWPATVLAGVIYSATPSLDLDIGYQSTVHAAVATREWLVGFTYRFAP
jgi:hypothetical protein